MRYFEDEKDYTKWAIKQAKLRGWKAAHLPTMRPVRRKFGTIAVPVTEGAGWPDLFLLHPTLGPVWVELKMDGGRLREAQVEWLNALREAGLRVFVFYPHHQDDLLAVLDGLPTQTLFDETAEAVAT